MSSNQKNIIPVPTNEPIRDYIKDARERELLQLELEKQSKAQIEIPIIINGKEIFEGETEKICSPHNHELNLGSYHKASKENVELAIQSANEAAKNWAKVSWQDRAAIFLKAANLLTTKYRYEILAATMITQSKTSYQAEIDAVCELADFWRFNCYFLENITNQQPMYDTRDSWNKAIYRPLEGFILAIAPFNFTAIAGNLCSSPALMGNVVLFKPSSNAVLSSYIIMKILKEAGLPDGVINFIPGRGSVIGEIAINNPNFSGVHFTGSTNTFNNMWAQIGSNIAKGVYKTYPRIVGETGGKDFLIAAPDSDVDALANAMFLGSFQYQGQKCSALSRAYIPQSMWPEVKEKLIQMSKKVKVGDVKNPDTFMGAVIDSKSFDNISEYVEGAKKDANATVVFGGTCNKDKGFFIEPTLIETTDPKYRTMQEEIFGPVLTVYPYKDAELEETLTLVDETSPYALTGAIFAKDRNTIRMMTDRLYQAAGNLYINDKPTGAVVGQQPFGGARLSGTNDKAGSAQNLFRWTSTCIIKETFSPYVNVF